MPVLQHLTERNNNRVTFDPSNHNHMRAYLMLTQGRQHPTLRFVVEHPFTDVYSMMHAKIGRAWAAMLLSTEPAPLQEAA